MICIQFVAVAVQSEEDVFKKVTPETHFALDPPLVESGLKTITLIRDLEYLMHTKFHQNPSSDSGEEVENVNCLTDDGQRTTDNA